MLYIAAIATIVVWILIYLLERKTLYHLEIKKLDKKAFLESVTTYRQGLKKQKCKIIIENKNLAKLKVDFIFSSPSTLHRDNIETFLDQNIADCNPGTISWNT